MLLMPGILMKNKILRNCRRSPGLESTYAGIFFFQRKRITSGLASKDHEKQIYPDGQTWCKGGRRGQKGQRSVEPLLQCPPVEEAPTLGTEAWVAILYFNGNCMSPTHSVPYLLSFIFPKASWGSKATKFLVYVCVSKYVCIHGNVWGNVCTHACKCWHICAGKRSVSALIP